MNENVPQKTANLKHSAPQKEKAFLYGALLTVILFWSSAFVGIRYVLNDYHPGSLALLRFLVASLTMLCLYLLLPKRTKPHLIELFSMLGLGVIGIGVYNLALNVGEITVNAAVASFIISLIPVVTMVLSVTFFGETLSKKGLYGIFISVIGLMLISGTQIFVLDASFGLLCLCVATFSGASYTLLQRHFVNRFHPIEVTAFIIWGGTLCFFFFTPLLITDIKIAPLQSTLIVIYLGIFPAALAYAAWGYVISKLRPSKAALYLYLLPISSTLMSIAFLDEAPRILSLIGGIIALLGAVYTAKNH